MAPAAPFVHVTLRCREAGTEATDIPAQLDSAADRTVIPGRLVDQLALVPLDEVPVSGFGGQRYLLPTYRLELDIRHLQSWVIEVLAHSEEGVVLRGRAVLNHHRIVLDGAQLTLEVG